MATSTANKTTPKVALPTPTAESTIRLTPATQGHIRSLRKFRDAEKLAKDTADAYRVAILEVFAGITSNTFGVDARGKRLVSVKLIESSERIDWKLLEKHNPELYLTVRSMLDPYIIPKGAGDPTIRVDCL